MTSSNRRGLVETVNAVMNVVSRVPHNLSQIQRYGNTNYYKLRRIIDALLDMEFMSFIMRDGRKVYFLTDSGKDYLRLTEEVLSVSDLCRKD